VNPESQCKTTLAFIAVPSQVLLLLMFNILLGHQSVWNNYNHSIENIILSQYKMNVQALGPDLSFSHEVCLWFGKLITPELIT